MVVFPFSDHLISSIIQDLINAIGIIKPYCKDDDPEGVFNAIRVNALFPHNLAQSSIDIDDNNLEKGKLPQKSRIRCDKIYTLSKNIVVKKFNKLDKKTFELIKQKISYLINDNVKGVG